MAFFTLTLLFLILQFSSSVGFGFRGWSAANAVAAARKSSSCLYVKHQVTIRHDGKDTVLEVDERMSILEAALDANIELPYDCKLGVCLTCPSKILSGEVDQAEGTLEDGVKEQGFALTCISYPRSDVLITSIEENELVDAQFYSGSGGSVRK